MRANERGNIKIRKIDDKTAATANIEIHLPAPVVTRRLMPYAFLQTVRSISPNSCVIRDDKPEFLTVTEVLKDGVERTMTYLRRELELELGGAIQEQHLRSSLEELFIKRRIYKIRSLSKQRICYMLGHIRS